MSGQKGQFQLRKGKVLGWVGERVGEQLEKTWLQWVWVKLMVW